MTRAGDENTPSNTAQTAAPDHGAVRDYWRAKAPHWTGWADSMAAMADRFNQPLLDAIAIQPGDRVLDLASGAGEPALTAAGRAGPQGLTVASDLIPDMLSSLRARGDGAPIVAVAADMQALPFAPASFDKVSCRFGIMFPPDVQKALLAAYPDTLHFNVYPTRRSASYPQWVYEAIRENATSATLLLS